MAVARQHGRGNRTKARAPKDPRPGVINLEEEFKKLDEQWAEQQRREQELREQQRHQESEE